MNSFTSTLLAGVLLTSVVFADEPNTYDDVPIANTLQPEYPPETHALPIPKMADLPLADGPFKGTVGSLKQYKCPDWFRDGKFGIWAHWGPQAVPEDGDWYARNMYEQGNGDYEDHIKVYGHPSKPGCGYKDIIPLWKAEKWDPDRLMALYKAAGAHYFVAQAVHHDNFDNWNSKYHKWNSVNMGPHKDMVGLWQQAAKKQGLRFGVSEHLGASFTWFQDSHGADTSGPFAGIPYDGAASDNWDLYHLPANAGDTSWYTSDQRWIQEWYARIYDVVDQYKPDLLYSDGGLPFQSVGRTIVAQLYNTSIKANGGQLEAVYNCKENGSGEFTQGTCVQDVERGGMNDVQPFPWQTDTSTGDWFYRKGDHYKSADEVIHTLTDIVSKNGNLLLNVVQYPDGSLPPEMETFLSDMADWMKVNSTAIFGTRPWTVCGEGPTTAQNGAFKDNITYRPQDIRFTQKDGDIYAITLGLPTGQTLIRCLASNSPLVSGEPTQVTLLGATDPVKWSRTTDGLVIQLPASLPCKSALCFKISGLTTVTDVPTYTLKAFKSQLNETIPAKAGADGSIDLPAGTALLNGSNIQLQGDGNSVSIGYWNNPTDFASWKIKAAPGTYKVMVEMGSNDADSHFIIDTGATQLSARSQGTGGWDSYKPVDVGTIQINSTDPITLKVTPKSADAWKPINIRSIELVPSS